MSGANRETSEIHEVAASRLRRHGQIYTRGRRAVVDALIATGKPVTIPDVLVHDPSLAQSSAYRNLAVLEDAEVVRRIVSADEFARYELDEGLTEHHHHLICVACGSVADVTIPAGIERTLDHAVIAIEAETGFVTDQHRLDLLGRCADCHMAS